MLKLQPLPDINYTQLKMWPRTANSPSNEAFKHLYRVQCMMEGAHFHIALL